MTIKPVAKAEMLIRRPVAEVFRAFTDPAVTSKFWFSKGSAPLAPGKTVTWTWEMYGFSVDVAVKAVEENACILVEWQAYGATTPIEWVFTPRADGTTFVSVTNSGFPGSEAEATQHALDSTEGFSFVLAGAKAWLEHGVQLDLVPDRFPDGLPGSSEADAEDAIEIVVELTAPPERSWQLLTENSHVRIWWGPHVTLDARPGGRLREVWSDGGREVVTSGTVGRCEPPHLLTMSWADDDWAGETQVSFSLSEANGATRLKLVHSGWRIHQPSTRRALMDAHAQGWAGHLQRLARYIQASSHEGGRIDAESHRQVG